ncbi:MAG: hypothetical protein HY658_03420 [Actinobacteria bacterium]|nr:hypothetical protein [Actinomycetota bacterium]
MDAFKGLNWTSRPGRYLRGFSLFWILAGLGFVVAGVVFPEPRSTFLGIGVIWALVGLLLRGIGTRMTHSYERRQRLLATGLPGRATILEMTQTGVLVNDQPQVELKMLVEVEGRPPHEVTQKAIVPLIALGRLSSGQPLPVKVDPANPNDLAIEWEAAPVEPAVAAGASPDAEPSTTVAPVVPVAPAPPATPASPVGAVLDFPGVGPISLADLRDRLAGRGVEASARVENVIDIGVSMDGMKLLVLDLSVTVPGKPPYRSTGPSLVPGDRTDRAVEGATLPVRVDPDHPDVLMVDWDRA